MQKIIKIIRKKIPKIKKNKSKKNLFKKEKLKIFFKNENELNFSPKRRSFNIFKTKLKYQNYNENIKNIYLYYLIIWIILCISSLYLLFFSHYFQLKNIDIIRNDENVNINIIYKTIDNFRFYPIFFIDKKLIEEKIKYSQPNIDNIEIKKILPDSIKITLSSKKNLFKTIINGKTYILTENWVILPSNKETNLEELNIIWLDFLWIIDYKKILIEDNIKNINYIIESIKNTNSFINISKLNYYKKEQELHIITNDDIILIFDLQKDRITQVKKLNIFYKEKKNSIKTKIIYIDLRINGRIIYCDSSNEFQCKKNIKEIYN